MKPLFIIVNGHPGTGKTTLAHRLAHELKLPVFCKDEVKEVMFDQLGWADKEWSQKLSLASYRVMDYVIESTLAAGVGMIVESNFIAEFDSERIGRAIERHGVSGVQLLLYADETVRSERFMQRITSGNRHPGHHLLDGQQEHLDDDKRMPLSIAVPLIKMNTTDFASIDYVGLLTQIKMLQ